MYVFLTVLKIYSVLYLWLSVLFLSIAPGLSFEKTCIRRVLCISDVRKRNRIVVEYRIRFSSGNSPGNSFETICDLYEDTTKYM